MPKRKMFIQNEIYHVYNKSFDGTILFVNNNDYKKLITDLIDLLEIFNNIELLSYSVLPNHFHLMLKSLEDGYHISSFMCRLLGRYANYYKNNYLHERGTKVFKGRFKSKQIVNYFYFERCLTYINLNPVKHEYVKHIKDWKYSSYHEIFSGNEKLINSKHFNRFKTIINLNKEFIKKQYEDYEFEF